MRLRGLVVVAVAAWGCMTPSVFAQQTFNSGSTGADGAFNPPANTTTTLTLPPDGVFNFTTVSIRGGAAVRFTRNAANTPVTILATGDVVIAGVIDVSGGLGGRPCGLVCLGPNGGAGGPGGFDGGSGANGIVSTTGGAGLGPGGGRGGAPGVAGVPGGSAGYAFPGGGTNGGPAYGNATLLPLIGGSGGGGGGSDFGLTAGGGGGGGGAILIASSGTITLSGAINASGGPGLGNGDSQLNVGFSGGGSGGAVRLAATSLALEAGFINVAGTGNGPISGGSAGRVRIEAFNNLRFDGLPSGLTIGGAGAVPSIGFPIPTFLSNAPTLRIISVGGVAAPAVPTAAFSSPDLTLPGTTVNPVTVNVAASNVPVGSSVTMTARGETGPATSASGVLTGTQASSTASISLAISLDQPSIISATTSFTLAEVPGNPAVVAGGEEVERIRVSTNGGGTSHVVYITKSGREVVATPR